MSANKTQGTNNTESAEDEILQDTFCPVCHKPAVRHYLPFCSKRCADVDLNRWFNGVYSLPMDEQDDEDTQVLSEIAKEETDK